MKILEKQKAIHLRRQGRSLNEISRLLKVSKSSASLWLKDVVLSQEALKNLENTVSKGQLASQQAKRVLTKHKERDALSRANEVLSSVILNKNISKILCAMIYYCEGAKSTKRIAFSNSDPLLMKMFLTLFRESFHLNENKLSVCVHLHDYHDKDKQLKFWSKTTSIPLSQFTKPYQKDNSGLYKKEGYQGCAHVRYHDVKIAREMKALALEFMKSTKMGL